MKLATLAASAVADEAVARVQEHLQSLALYLGSTGAELGTRSTSLWEAVHYLARYGVTGEARPVDGMAGEAYLHESWLTVLPCLYDSALRQGDWPGQLDDEAEAEPESAVEVALVAALARQRIEAGEHVTGRELGVLGGCNGSYVRQQRLAGGLRGTDEKPARYTARESKRWLGARGAAGFGG